MKLVFLLCLVAFLAVAVSGSASQKDVIVTYPNDTPSSVMAQAMDAIRSAVSKLPSIWLQDYRSSQITAQGGVITHEYKLIKAFAAKAPAQALQTVSTLNTKYNPTIEEDQTMYIANDGH
ncbi:MAG: hypothetical protein M1819_001582 [Sarea resinae]|nr:MAG: hypothetical protein M1819_001582 [Sarea resinae]